MTRTEDIVSTIFLRDSYREERMHYLWRMLAATALLLALSSLGTLLLMGKENPYRYVLLDHGGSVLDIVPLDRPKHDDGFVVQWAINATTQAHTFDFKNYPSQFQEAQRKMTVFGWRAYEKAMKESGNLDAVRQHRLVATAVPTGPGRILKKGHLADRHAWRIEFPMLVTYQSSKHTTSQNLLVTVVVVRQPEYVQGDGLGIRSIIAE